MKKKNLIILLLLPFLVALVGIPIINTAFNIIKNEIVHIDWDYDDMEAFKLQNTPYELKANPIYANPRGDNNDDFLSWSVENINKSEPPHCVIENNMLSTLSLGEVNITCSNKSGSVFRLMHAIVYENGVIIANPVIQKSQTNIDKMEYYGEYDLVNNIKQKATIDYNISVIPNDMKSAFEIKSITDNLSLSDDLSKISILKSGYGEIVLGFKEEEIGLDCKINFMVVENGVNVYDYETLISCSGNKGDGEIIVLRKSFESQDRYNNSSKNNVEMFGTYSEATKKYNFINEVYAFDTTSNTEYIDQWNEFVKTETNYKPIEKTIYAGLRITKDFYGNGFTLNFHNLAYPYDKVNVVNNNETHVVAKLNNDNLFRGPKPFYLLGNPDNIPLIGSYGQDNIGLYVDGNNIKVNDLVVKNCDFGNNISNLEYTGTVLETNGNDITIKNSRLSSGKNVLRSFSSQNVLIDNCLLNYSRNFLLVVGANEYIKEDNHALQSFKSLDGSMISDTLSNFLSENNLGDEILNNYLQGNFTPDEINAYKEALESIQDGLTTNELLEYKGSITINDSIFAKSGIAAVALESYFNGPYLHSSSPSSINSLFQMLNDENGNKIIPYNPKSISGSSYPVKVNIKGKTIFSDYKNISNLDLSGLILENISTVVNSVGYEYTISIDDIFPLKKILVQDAKEQGLIKTKDETGKQEEFINIPIAFYGGGNNLSTVSFEQMENSEILDHSIAVDFLEEYLALPEPIDFVRQIMDVMLKCVTVVTGFNPFKFYIQAYDENIENIEANKILQENAKGV